MRPAAASRGRPPRRTAKSHGRATVRRDWWLCSGEIDVEPAGGRPHWPIGWPAELEPGDATWRGARLATAAWLNALVESPRPRRARSTLRSRRAGATTRGAGYSSLSYPLVADSRLSATIARFADHLSHLRDFVVNVSEEVVPLPGTRHLRSGPRPGPCFLSVGRDPERPVRLYERRQRSNRAGHAGGGRR